MTSFSVADIAERVGGAVHGEPDGTITGLAAADVAGPGDLTLILTPEWAAGLSDSAATAALAPNDLDVPETSVTLIRVDNARLALATVAPLFFPEPQPEPGVSAAATVHPDAEIGHRVSIGPNAVVEAGAVIGDDTHIGAATVVEAGAIVGASCRIAPNCTIYGCVRMGDRVRLLPGVRLGSDGFGFTAGPAGLVRMPQLGLCIVGDDVDIGANSTVDRGALGDTVIGSGTRIDNLVMIAHNVRIGRNCIIVGQAGMGGSVTLGDGVQLAGQVGIADHVTIGDGVRIGAQSGVFRDKPDAGAYFGSPALPAREGFRMVSSLQRLHQLFRRVKKLETAVFDEDG